AARDQGDSGARARAVETPSEATAAPPKGKRESAARAKAAADLGDNLSRRALIGVLVAFAVSGFVALAYEVIWSRVLALIIGSSVYAFSIMLTTFLIGLAA